VAVLAQAVTVVNEGPDWWQTLGIALLGALVGGLLGAMGSRWATRRDLVERNRHALLMEDLPKYRDAVEALNRSTRMGTVRVGAAAQADLYEVLEQIDVRTRILSTKERRLGAKALASAGDVSAVNIITTVLAHEAAERTVSWSARQRDNISRRIGR